MRALNSVRDREKAEIALFISLEKPTAGTILMPVLILTLVVLTIVHARRQALPPA